MKKITCREMGGDCDAVITGETAEELMANGKKHVHDLAESGDEVHKGVVEKMGQLSEEDHKKWAEDFAAKFDSLEEA